MERKGERRQRHEVVVGSIQIKGDENKKVHVSFNGVRSKMLKRQFKDYMKDKYNILPFLSSPGLVTQFLKALGEKDLGYIQQWFRDHREEELDQMGFGHLE